MIPKPLQLKPLAALAVLCMPMLAAQAQTSLTCNTLFGASVTVGANSAQVCATTLENLYARGIRDIDALFPGYQGNEAVVSNARLTGVATNISYAQNSADLRFTIPDLGINELFQGSTRVNSARLLKDFLANNGDLRGRLVRAQANNSPNNAITGPGGVLTNAVTSDFDGSFGDMATRIATSLPSAQGGSGNLIGIGMVVSKFDIAGTSVKTLSIPLSYTVRNDIDPRRQALLRGGIGVVDSEGTKAYNARFSAGYRFPMSDEWTLTPMLGGAVTGSKDTSVYTGILNASVASTYAIELGGFDLTVGNMLGYYLSFKPPGGNAGVDPGLGQLALRNGVLLSQPITIGGSKMSVEYGLSDTRYLGGSLYQKNSQDLSVSLGTNKSAFSARSFFRATLLLQRARESKGVALNVNYWF